MTKGFNDAVDLREKIGSKLLKTGFRRTADGSKVPLMTSVTSVLIYYSYSFN